MSNIKVIDVNEEAKQEAVEEPQVIEEAKEEGVEHEVSCNTHEPTIEVVEEAKEEVVEKPKAKVEQLSQSESSLGLRPKPKPSDRVDCKTCGKNLSYKNYRYRHEKYVQKNLNL